MSKTTPDYLPARMLNEFVYCPRLFYYEWVEQVFANNRETVEGSIRHRKVDTGKGALPAAEEIAEEDKLHSRSVTLSSDEHGLIAKMDLIETTDGVATPVDYKRGSPRKGDGGTPEMWDTDRIQLAVQAIVLRDNGYQCDEAVSYYVATKQRVRIAIDDEVIRETLEQLQNARETAESDQIPPPLVDSPKCPRCSLVGICLPHETSAVSSAKLGRPADKQLTLFDAGRPAQATTAALPVRREPRRLVPARDDLRPLYLNKQGLHVGVSSGVLKIKEKGKLIQEVRIGEICQLNVMGNVQLTTQAIQTLCRHQIPIAYYSQGSWFYGVTQGLGVKNINLRRDQFRLAGVPSFCLRIARALVAGKIRNQRTMLQRNHLEPPAGDISQMKCLYEDAEHAESVEQLLGIEGNAARLYFENFAQMIKVEDGHSPEAGNGKASDLTFDFKGRNRRPPRDPVNALLSLAYGVLTKDLTVITQVIGLDPYLGFFHQPRFGRASLALDLMEPFRPLIADSAVLSAINTRMVAPKDFVKAGESTALTPDGRKAFYRAYEQRMDSLVTHPMFGYRVNYRRVLEIQSRLLARVLTGELAAYPVFTTR